MTITFVLRTSLRTSISEFIHFLDGKETPAYDISREDFLDTLSNVLYKSIYQRYQEFLSNRKKDLQDLESSQFIEDEDVIDFLITVFPTYFDLAGQGPFHDMLLKSNKTTFSIIFNWLNDYRTSELDGLRDPSSQSPLFGIFSQSTVHTLLYSLLVDACAFLDDIENEHVAQKCDEIKDAIWGDLIDYLRRLSIDEANTPSQRSDDLKRTPSEDRFVSGGPNQQDGTTQAIEYWEWFLAWEDEFRGSALENLEVKLSLNVQALRAVCQDKLDMSRIIPIVQSSGTGKSRLAEQYTINRMLG
jgi:hypothetical protein